MTIPEGLSPQTVGVKIGPHPGDSQDTAISRDPPLCSLRTLTLVKVCLKDIPPPPGAEKR